MSDPVLLKSVENLAAQVRHLQFQLVEAQKAHLAALSHHNAFLRARLERVEGETATRAPFAPAEAVADEPGPGVSAPSGPARRGLTDDELRYVLTSWAEALGETAASARDVLTFARDQKDPEGVALLRALAMVGDTPRAIGHAIDRETGRVVAGLSFTQCGVHRGARRWKVCGTKRLAADKDVVELLRRRWGRPPAKGEEPTTVEN